MCYNYFTVVFLSVCADRVESMTKEIGVNICTVNGEDMVEYEGMTYSFTGLAKQIFGKKNAVANPHFLKRQRELLNDIRKRLGMKGIQKNRRCHMAQGLIAGGTDYSEQTILDIKSDIEYWMKYSQEIKNEFTQTITELKQNNYWETKVPYDFRAFCLSVGKICDTIYSDFQVVKTAIENDMITKREVTLMRHIFELVCKCEDEDIHTFKNVDQDGYWYEYGHPMFTKVEDLYGDCGDFFATLKDVSNAAYRMEDYVKEEIVSQTSINNSLNIQTGDNADFRKASISAGQKESDGKQLSKDSFIKKFWWAFIVPVAAAVIAGIILFLLKMN